MNKSTGYTLIEVLVAMVIFSVLMTLAVSSYRYFFTSVNSQKQQSDAVSMLAKRKLINSSVNKVVPYYYLSFNNKPVLFFYGEKSHVSFISESPSYLNEPLVVSTLYVTDSGNELRYCERPLGKVKLTDYVFREGDCEMSEPYLQAEGIDISYFGWKDGFELSNFYSEYLNVASKPLPKWRTQYYSSETLVLPIYIRVKHTMTNSLIPKMFMFKLPDELPGAKRDKSEFSG